MKLGPVSFPDGGNIAGIVIIVLVVAAIGRIALPASKYNPFNYSAT